jgi:hypothetical protein
VHELIGTSVGGVVPGQKVLERLQGGGKQKRHRGGGVREGVHVCVHHVEDEVLAGLVVPVVVLVYLAVQTHFAQVLRSGVDKNRVHVPAQRAILRASIGGIDQHLLANDVVTHNSLRRARPAAVASLVGAVRSVQRARLVLSLHLAIRVEPAAGEGTRAVGRDKLRPLALGQAQEVLRVGEEVLRELGHSGGRDGQARGGGAERITYRA